MNRPNPYSDSQNPSSPPLRDAIDRGETSEEATSEIPLPDPAAAPLGTDAEVARTAPSPPPTGAELEQALRRNKRAHSHRRRSRFLRRPR